MELKALRNYQFNRIIRCEWFRQGVVSPLPPPPPGPCCATIIGNGIAESVSHSLTHLATGNQRVALIRKQLDRAGHHTPIYHTQSHSHLTQVYAAAHVCMLSFKFGIV
jgi:hypothetical protein